MELLRMMVSVDYVFVEGYGCFRYRVLFMVMKIGIVEWKMMNVLMLVWRRSFELVKRFM